MNEKKMPGFTAERSLFGPNLPDGAESNTYFPAPSGVLPQQFGTLGLPAPIPGVPERGSGPPVEVGPFPQECSPCEWRWCNIETINLGGRPVRIYEYTWCNSIQRCRLFSNPDRTLSTVCGPCFDQRCGLNL